MLKCIVFILSRLLFYNYFVIVLNMIDKIKINKVAYLLDISFQTLRRWDKEKKLISRRDSKGKHRYYFKSDIEDFLINNYKYLLEVFLKWSFSKVPPEVDLKFYCQDSYIFKSRLLGLEEFLRKNKLFIDNYSLITSITGEMGNNSFDHNIGKWPNITGILFAHSPKYKKILLSDRGQGVYTTLKRIKPNLKNDKEALKVAFNEIISGRAPENRGNGLKYVKRIIETTNMELNFYSGNARLHIKGKNNISIESSDKKLQGCFVILSY
jgi:hypothetical protein